MDSLERRLVEHIASDEAALSRIDKNIERIVNRLDKFENNHFAHIEPDIRELKGFALRMEKMVEGMISQLRDGVREYHEFRIAQAAKNSELEQKIETNNVKESSNSSWLRDLVMLLIAALAGGAIGFFFSK